MLTASESNAKKQVVNWVAAVIGVLVLAAGGLFWYQKQQAAETERRFAVEEATRKEAEAKRFDATRIAAEYGTSTVYIEASWKLIDVASKRAVYHQFEVIETNAESGKKEPIALASLFSVARRRHRTPADP